MREEGGMQGREAGAAPELSSVGTLNDSRAPGLSVGDRMPPVRQPGWLLQSRERLGGKVGGK
jgi:hypothetical protein